LRIIKKWLDRVFAFWDYEHVGGVTFRCGWLDDTVFEEDLDDVFMELWISSWFGLDGSS
jgi:hypothetical protein